MESAEVVRGAGRALEGVGVAVIMLGAAIATVRFLPRLTKEPTDAYTGFRRALGRAILLGLEFLVAGDIIRTVAVEPDFRGVGLLAIIVAIRTFLSIELEMEIEGR